MHLDEIVSRFQNAKLIGENQYQCRCPVHQDDKASLTITEEDNKILMYDHARMRDSNDSKSCRTN